ncbi:MAG: GTPase domain-containing protein [Candidatus Lokiarchaeota archaeon]
MESIKNLIRRLKKKRKLIRMTIVGDGAVGKTTLVQAMLKYTKFNGNSFNLYSENLEKINRTPFMEIESWNYRDLQIQCFDLAGQRTVGSHPLDILRDQVVKSIDIYIFVFSLNRFESFENLQNWLELCLDEGTKKLQRDKNNQIGLILVGNKADLDKNVPEELINPVVGENKYFNEYIETSAIKGIGIKELLDTIGEIGKKLLNLNE